MANNNRQSRDGSVNLLDIFFYLLSYWYVFLAVTVLLVGAAWLKCEKSDLQYVARATVIIKDPSNTRSTTRMDTYSGLINRTNVSNEILQFKSKRLMTETVRRLEANVDYRTVEGLREIELYDRTPLKVIFPDAMAEMNVFLDVTVGSDSTFTVNCGGSERIVAFNDTLSMNGGAVTISPSSFYSPEWTGKTVKVSHVNPLIRAKQFLSCLTIEQLSDDASILTFTMQDQNVNRACNLIDMLVEVYNEDAVADKNQVAVNTAQFINERIAIIGRELGDVEDRLQAFKTEHHVISVDEAANQYLAQGRSSNALVVEMETRIRLAGYIKDYLQDPAKASEMIPTNIGLEDLRVEGQINQYNNLKIQRDRLVSESS